MKHWLPAIILIFVIGAAQGEAQGDPTNPIEETHEATDPIYVPRIGSGIGKHRSGSGNVRGKKAVEEIGSILLSM